MRTPKYTSLQWFHLLLVVLAVLAATTGRAAAQALLVDRLGNGTELVFVAQPLSDATTIAWLDMNEEGEPEPQHLSSGRLTLAADVAAVLAPAAGEPAPPVVVVVGPTQASEVRGLLDRVLAQARPSNAGAVVPEPLGEGGVQRKLGAAGSPATLRLRLPLPGAADSDRAPAEVLLELLPELVRTELPGLRCQLEDDAGVVEAQVDPELAELKLRRLRLALARAAAEPMLDAERVEAARSRLLVRRQARFEEHPDGALVLLRVWREGGAAAVREHLFGLEAVTIERVREAANQWLSHHPGAAELVLPPQVFDPRFAPPPERMRLENDLSVAVLERPAVQLAALSLRPVLVPDLDGSLAATILTRLATVVRSGPMAPGWVRVRSEPASLELAAPADSFGELCEVLSAALAQVCEDERPVAASSVDARHRALVMMAGSLGLGDVGELSPASLLRADNLAIGVVAPDGEAALEAMRKLLVEELHQPGVTAGRSFGTTPRSREATPGEVAVLAVVLELPPETGDAVPGLVRALLSERAGEHVGECSLQVLSPLVPGRSVLLLLFEATMPLDELEQLLEQRWPALLADVDEETLATQRREAVAEAVAAASGALGRARSCAAMAASGGRWRSSSEVEMELLTAEAAQVNEILALYRDLNALPTTGAGPMPLAELDGRR